MPWTITATQDDASWFDDLVQDIIARDIPPLPPHDLRVGHVEAHWHQVEPGRAYVTSNPETGSCDDRILVEAMVMAALEPYGFKRAVYTLRWDHSDLVKHAAWSDIEDNARQLVQGGGVTLQTNTPDVIMGVVKSQTKPGVAYQTEIHRADPTSGAISTSHCTCDWGQFQNTPRTRIWKRFQNRPCKHILATWWQSQAVPQGGQQDPNGQMSLFDMGGYAAPSSMGIMQKSPTPNPNAWFMQPGAPANPWNQNPWNQNTNTLVTGPGGASQPFSPDLGQFGGNPLGQGAPSPEDVLPQFPMDPTMMPEVNPASTPGGRPGPTPTNPIQYPGGTFSSWRPSIMSRVSGEQQYQNGDMVRLLKPDVGTLVGRSAEHGAGQDVTLPAGSVGEVLGVQGGLVQVLFMGKQFDQNSFFEPYGATLWCWPSYLAPSPNTPPGPAIRRT